MKAEQNQRTAKITVQVDPSNHAWLWRERRRRDRSIAWIINEAVRQYRERLERNKSSK